MKANRTITIIVMLLIVMWIGRIYGINTANSSEIRYRIGETIDCGDIMIQPIKSGLVNTSDFCSDNNINLEVIEDHKDSYIIFVRFKITNKSNSNISKSQVVDFVNVGFESDIWGSAPDPLLTSLLNDSVHEMIAPEESFDLCLATEIDASLFKSEHFKMIDSYKYCYILRQYPNKIGIELDVSGF